MDYPEGAIVRVEDMLPIERAFGEAMHEDCTDPPAGHPFADHSPWSGGDLDGTETWPSFVERLRRHGLTLTLAGFVVCPLCHDPELVEDIVGGVCLTCADAIAFAQNARRGAIVVPTADDVDFGEGAPSDSQQSPCPACGSRSCDFECPD